MSVNGLVLIGDSWNVRHASKTRDGRKIGELGGFGIEGGRARVDLEGAHTLDCPLEFAQPA